MNDSIREQVWNEQLLKGVRRSIEIAHLRCLSFHEICNRIEHLHENDDETDYVFRLTELDLNEAEFVQLFRSMQSLAENCEKINSKRRAKLERILLRLLRILPVDLANRCAIPYVSHRLKSRRQWAYSALKRKEISQSIAATLLKVYRRSGDQVALELIARNPERVAESDPILLLHELEQRYWRGRVMEGLIMFDREKAIALSHQYPIEFAHATGRSPSEDLIKPLLRLLPENQNDLDFLSMYAYALGKLECFDELHKLDQYISTTFHLDPMLE